MGSLEILLSHTKTIVATSEATACRTSSISRPRTNCTFCARVTHRPTDLHDMHGMQKQSSRTIANLSGNDPGARVHGPARPSEAGAGKCLLMRHMRRTRQPRAAPVRTHKGRRACGGVKADHPQLSWPKSTGQLHLGDAGTAFRSCCNHGACRRSRLQQVDVQAAPRRLQRCRWRLHPAGCFSTGLLGKGK